MRSLTTIRRVHTINDIENADRIQLAMVDGWTAIIKKGEFSPGDLGVFFEIDSFLPASDKRFEFLMTRGTKTFDNIEGFRIRTQKMRGELSQGLFLPLNSFPEIVNRIEEMEITMDDAIDQGIDFSEMIGVLKFERAEPQAANASGHFPSFIKKTDETRIQNIYRRLVHNVPSDARYYPTLKLDGSSTTIALVERKKYEAYYKTEDDAVIRSLMINNKWFDVIACSRNLQIKNDENSHFIQSLLNGDMVEKLIAIGTDLDISLAIQGECIGPGIQGNPEKLDQFRFYAFNLWDIDNQEYYPYSITKDVFKDFGVMGVPLVDEPFNPFERFTNLEELLAFSDGGSLNAKRREGIVYKSDQHGSFKAISNAWLLDPRNA